MPCDSAVTISSFSCRIARPRGLTTSPNACGNGSSSSTRHTIRSAPLPDLLIGIASLCRDHLNSGREPLEKADENLYVAKREGKACVVGG